MKITQRIRVTKQNYASDSGDYFIYRVTPLGQIQMKRHPIYRQFSVISRSSLILDEEYDAELEVRVKGGANEYEVTRIHFNFPTSPREQWEFLARYCANNSAKKLFKRLSLEFSADVAILDLFQDQKRREEIQESLIVYGLDTKFEVISTRIGNMQAAAQFVAALPAAIADELTDHEAEKLAGIVKNNPDLSAAEFLDDPWLAMHIEGFGFKRVDGLRAKLHKADPTNPAYAEDNRFRVYYGAYDVLENRVFRQGHTYVTTYEFKSLMVRDLKLPQELVSNFIDYDYAGIAVFGYFRIYVGEGIITSQRMYDAERRIYGMMTESTRPEPIEGWDKALEVYTQANNLTLTDEQLSIFKSVNENRFSLLTGPGGTGKTFTVAELIRFAKSRGLKVALMAPTGKAAQVLKSYAGHKAHTIHSAFNIQPGKLGGAGTVPKSKPDLIVIDEFSMVDSELLGDILATYEAAGEDLPRLLFIGDENQLPSVGAGNLLHSFIKLRLVALTRLTKVFRIKSTLGGITQLTEGLRKGIFPFKNNDGEIFPVEKDFWGWHTPDPTDVFTRTLQAYRTMINLGINIEDIVVLTPKNGQMTGQRELNTHLQAIARESLELPIEAPCHTINAYGTKVNFYEGDLIMSLENQKLFVTRNKSATIMDFSDSSPTLAVSNGDVGRVTHIGHDFLLAEFDSTSVFVQDSDLKKYQLGYAYTIHKSQGSEAKYGIMVATSSDAFQLNSNLLYTGASRFKEKLYLIGDFNTMRQKAKVFINRDRRTLLEHFDEMARIEF